MFRSMKTAVAAAALPSVQRQISLALAQSRVELAGMAADGASALEEVRRRRPDLLIADMELPVLEGASLLERILTGKGFAVRPACILMLHAGFPLPAREILEEKGALLIEKPLSGEVLAEAIQRLETTPPAFPAGEETLADRLLTELGVPEHLGRNCLKAAALLCAGDERWQHRLLDRLYPAAGAICGVTAAQAERAMRHAIGLAWQSDQFENQYRIFADTVDAGRGQPTCWEMISRLADILRLEG